MIKRLLLALMVALVATGASARILTGEKSFGPKLGYVSHNHSAVAGLVFQYNISTLLRLSPEIGVAFRHYDQDALLIDLNLEMPLTFTDGDKAALYPLVGVAFSSWAHHMHLPEDSKDVTSHANRLGANIGAGFDFKCNQTLKLNIEAKYTIVKSYSSFLATVGIAYLF